MFEWLIGVCAVSFALFLLCQSRMEMALRAHIGGENTFSASAYFLGGAVRHKFEGSVVRGEDGRLSITTAFNGNPVKVKRRENIFKREMVSPAARDLFIRRVDLESLGFSMTIGIASDAAITAQLCGLALTVLESAAGIVRILKPNARVLMRSAPNFREDCLRIRFSCIFRIKIGHIILIAARAAIDIAKGAIAAWLTRLKALCAPRWKTSKT